MRNTIYRIVMFVLLAATSAVAGAGQRPNVVLIVTDNQSELLPGAYGNREIRTPNIDALAQAGMKFTRALLNRHVDYY